MVQRTEKYPNRTITRFRYYIKAGLTPRQKINETYNLPEDYIPTGYFSAARLQFAARHDFRRYNRPVAN